MKKQITTPRDYFKSVLYYRRKVFAGSACAKVLNLLYGNYDNDSSSNNSMTMGEIISCCCVSNNDNDDHVDQKKSYQYLKKIILQMKKDGYLASDTESSYNRRYRLSQMGRWFAICQKLDNISFQSLCILSKVYNNAIKKDMRYMVSRYRMDFEYRYEEFASIASGIYSTSNIQKSIKMLTDRCLVYWKSDGMLKMSSEISHRLQRKYHDDLSALFLWIDEKSVLCQDYLRRNKKISKKTREMLGLLSPQRSNLTT